MFQEEPTKAIMHVRAGCVSGDADLERLRSEEKSVTFYIRWCWFYLSTTNCVTTGTFLNSGLLFPYLDKSKYFTGSVIKKAKIIYSLISEYLWSQAEIQSPELSELVITSVVAEAKEEGGRNTEMEGLWCGVSHHSAGFFFFFLERQSITIWKIIRCLREREWGVTVWLQSFSSEGTNSSGDG